MKKKIIFVLLLLLLAVTTTALADQFHYIGHMTTEVFKRKQEESYASYQSVGKISKSMHNIINKRLEDYDLSVGDVFAAFFASSETVVTLRITSVRNGVWTYDYYTIRL